MVSRDSTINLNWWETWLEEINPWKGEQASEERFVWLMCFGMPLNAWSHNTFKQIGNIWGQFLMVEEKTLKESSFEVAKILIASSQVQSIKGQLDLTVDKVNYKVRISEDESFRVVENSMINGLSDLRLKNVQDVNNVVESSSEVMVNKTVVEEANEAVSKEGAKHNDHQAEEATFSPNSKRGGSILNHRSADFNAVGSPQERSNNVEEDEKSLDDSNFNLSPISAANPLDETSTTVIVETQDIINPITKNLVSADNNGDAPDDSLKEINHCQFEVSEEDTVPIQSAVKSLQGKKKRKNINDILGFSKVKPVKGGGKKKNKGDARRSAIAAAALSASISSEGINNRNQILLNEAQAIWAINKIHGIGYDGDEHEVISKIASNLEAQDKGRAQCHL